MNQHVEMIFLCKKNADVWIRLKRIKQINKNDLFPVLPLK